jgi:hypothetical protein
MGTSAMTQQELIDERPTAPVQVDEDEVVGCKHLASAALKTGLC